MTSKFGTAINCIDGRTQRSVSDWVKQNMSVEYVDMVTEPGCDKALLQGNAELENQIKSKVQISVNAHKSAVVIIAGHHDCAGNPVSKEEHHSQIKQSVQKIKAWDLPVTVVGLWVNEDWNAEKISD